MTTFAQRMEQRALGIADVMAKERPQLAHLYADGRNIVPWFSAPCMFEGPADRVFLATNPGGNPDHFTRRLRPGTRDSAGDMSEGRRFNRWLDESWGEGKPKPAGEARNQVAVKRAFDALYGDGLGEQVLRDTPCFEVCPLRTYEARDIPYTVWDASVLWCHEVLEYLRPKTIISNGNREGVLSAWSAVQRMYGMYGFERLGKRQLFGNAALKWGRVTSGSLQGTILIGMPHLSRFGDRRLYNALRELSGEIDLA